MSLSSFFTSTIESGTLLLKLSTGHCIYGAALAVQLAPSFLGVPHPRYARRDGQCRRTLQDCHHSESAEFRVRMRLPLLGRENLDRIPDSCRRVSFDTRQVSFDSPWTATCNSFSDFCPHLPGSLPGLRTALMHRVASAAKKSFLKGFLFANSDCDFADIRWALVRRSDEMCWKDAHG